MDGLAGHYHRLLLVVGEGGSGKTRALREVAQRTGAPLINLSLELSGRLLELTQKQRALELPRVLDELVETAGGDLVLVDNTELLFEPSLHHDPVKLMQRLARHRS